MWQQIQNNINIDNYSGKEKKILSWLKRKDFNRIEKIYYNLSGRKIYSSSPLYIKRALRKLYFILNPKKKK